MLRQNFWQWTHLIHSIGPNTHVLGYFGPFCYCTKLDAKLAELEPLTHMFAKRSCVGIFHNKCTWSGPLFPKLMFLRISDRFVATQKSMQNWPSWCNLSTSSLNDVASEFFTMSAPDPLHWTQNSCLVRFWPFRYCMKVVAKLAEHVPLTHKFAKRSCAEIFCNELTSSTPLDPKVIFWGNLDCFVTAWNTMQNWPNWHN
jgi:hypothetical protein